MPTTSATDGPGAHDMKPGTTGGPHKGHNEPLASTNDNNVFPLLKGRISPFPQVSSERLTLSGVQAGSPPHL